MGTEQFCLKWNNHHSNMLTVFEQLLSNEALVDVTLACEGLSMKAHKMVLSACSPFFQDLFLENPCKHPIVILKDMKYRDLKAIVDFMYRGEVNVSEDQLTALLKTAETLKVKGLAEVMYENKQDSGVQNESMKRNVKSQVISCAMHHKENKIQPSPSVRRKHGKRRHSLSDSVHSDSDVPKKTKETSSSQIVEDSAIEDAVESDNQFKESVKYSSQRFDVNSSVDSQSVHCNNFKVEAYSIAPYVNSKENTSVEEIKSCDEVEFDVEPSRLMEQTLTENVPVFTDSHPPASIRPAPSQTTPIDNSGNVLDTQICLISKNGNGSSLVPTSLSTETPTSNNEFAQEDIKPANLLSFEDSRLSPAPGPSHHNDKNNSVLTYLDSSVVSTIPGPSNYQSENSIQHHPGQGDSRSQLNRMKDFQYNPYIDHSRHPALVALLPLVKDSNVCPICLKTYSSKHSVKRHLLMHKPFSRKFQCTICQKLFNWPGNLKTHIQTVHRRT